MTPELSHHHRDTVAKILSHPAGGNVEWREVLSLIDAIGTAEPQHDGKLKVTIGEETEIMTPPRGKDVDAQTTVDLRRMLEGAGLGSAQTSPRPDDRTRDFGDNRWGESGRDGG